MARAQYVVTTKGGQWFVRLDGQDYGPYQTQKEAIRQAVEAAHSSGKQGFNAQVLIQGADNKFRTEWTYGNDPYPPPG